MEARNRTPLDRDRWIHAAIEVLAEKGVEGVRVEVVAKHCGVTKGSFYWHFKDRRDLLDAVLHTWKTGRIRDIVKQTRAEPGKEAPQLYHVIDVYSANRNRKGILIELAVRDWARRDAAAHRAVEEVDAARLACGKALFVRLGLDQDEAAARSLLLYAYVFGQSLMVYDGYDDKRARLKSLIADIIAK